MAEETKKAAEKPAKAEKAAKKPRKRGRIANFFREYKSELKKVVWYPKNEVARDTGIVVASLVVAGVVIGVLDLIFTQIILLIGQIG